MQGILFCVGRKACRFAVLRCCVLDGFAEMVQSYGF